MMRQILIALFLLLPLFMLQNTRSMAQEQTALDYSAFGSLPVMHEGRLKPLHSFAQILLQQLSGRTALSNLSADAWLAQSLFDPGAASALPVFKVAPALRDELGLLAHKKLYTLEDLQSGIEASAPQVAALIDKPMDTLSDHEKALVHMHENVAAYLSLLRSFSALLPLDIELPETFSARLDGPPNFTALAKIEPDLQAGLARIIEAKGRNPEAYTPRELAIVRAAFHVETLRSAGEKNHLLRVIPGGWDEQQGDWFAPWDILLSGQGSPASAALLSNWQSLSDAYRNHNAANWDNAVQKILELTQQQSRDQINLQRLRIENFYRDYNPYEWVIGFYILAWVAAAFYTDKPTRFLALFAGLSTALGMTAHGAAIAARVYILTRPPVGTLYESVLFVSLICAVLGAALALKKRNSAILITSLIAALGLLLSADFIHDGPETLGVLSAVLNTNFWLGTHVLCVTTGYGLCIITAFLAHYALWVRAQNNGARWLQAQQILHPLSLFALLFMTLGTVLGGIWADQSWGRFWGWDPKENGALLIVLWLIWAQHSRLSQHLNPVGFAVALAFLNVIVALAWFGVNLLSTGLHSYGFTSGLAGGLLVFCSLETILIAGLYWAARRQRATAKGE